MSLSVLFLRSKKEEIAKASQPTLHPAEGVKCIHRLARLFSKNSRRFEQGSREIKEKKEKFESVSVHGIQRRRIFARGLFARLGCEARKAGRG